MTQNVISDLGAAHAFEGSYSALHRLMNASFILQGLLICTGALALRRVLAASRPGRAARLAFVLSGAGLLIVGFAPEDVDSRVHVAAAIMHFVCGSLAMLLVGVSLLRQSAGSRLGACLSLAAGGIALGATLLLGFRGSALWHSLHFALGAVERVAAYPLPLWLTIAGATLLVQHPRIELSRST